MNETRESSLILLLSSLFLSLIVRSSLLSFLVPMDIFPIKGLSLHPSSLSLSVPWMNK